MSRYRSDPEMLEFNPGVINKPSACANFLHYTWKTITCLLSHITLVSMVVSYCALGAYMFEALEVEHEREVKKNISQLRENVTLYLWKLTMEFDVLKSDNFTNYTLVYLKEFEGALVKAMTKDGWDGNENKDTVQWTTTGALFYSIIVITTIGYGHISPKTPWGKIVTIFYAILGIPLMLLCLSNIGDIMATSFRFLYWRICCYVCTKKPKRQRRNKSIRTHSRTVSESRFSRSRNASFRRSMRTSTRSADSGFGLSEIGHYSHSDTDLRYHNETRDNLARGSSLPRLRPALPAVNHKRSPVAPRGGSLDRRKFQKNLMEEVIELDPVLLAKTPILCNKYVIGTNEMIGNTVPGITTRSMEGSNRRAKSLPRNPQYLEPPRMPSPVPSDHSRRVRRKKSPPHHNPSPKMMTPLGYGHRSKYLDDPDSDDDNNDLDYYDDGGDDDDYYENSRTQIKPVPIWLCVFLVIGYIVAGAFLFSAWENWDPLDAAYFCFITLTTIGFGDLVPAAKGANRDGTMATTSIALCSLYLLFGIALLAMSFNLVQEEVIANVKSIAKTLGIIKSNHDDSDDDD